MQGYIDLQALSKIQPDQQDGTEDEEVDDDGSNAAAVREKAQRSLQSEPINSRTMGSRGKQRDELRALLEEFEFDKEPFPSQRYVGTLDS